MIDAFSLPMNDHQRYRLNPVRVSILQFDPTCHLLATGDSDCVVQVYCFQQNTFVLRRQFRSPVTAIEWKSNSRFNGFLGHCHIYIGFEDGSIQQLTFSSKLYPVGQCQLLHHAGVLTNLHSSKPNAR